MDATCGHCGVPLAADDMFCGSCGQPAASAAADFSWPYPGGSVPADAAAGQRTPNAQYLGHRLVFDKVPETSFDPTGNPRLLRQFFVHALLYFLVFAAGGLAAGLALLVIANGISSALSLWSFGAQITGLALLCLFWLIPLPVQLSEWKFFVDGKAQVAPVTFDHIAWALRRRRTPLDMVRVRRLKLAGGQRRDYLEIRRGMFSGLISCFGYGEDLYVGWTMWFRISPLHWLLMFIASWWRTLRRPDADICVSLRYDYARAMREAVHSVAREGVDVAVGEARPHGHDIGKSLPVAVAEIDL